MKSPRSSGQGRRRRPPGLLRPADQRGHGGPRDQRDRVNPKIWEQCAIIITYDESDGFYDHVPPRILSYGPDGLPLSRGIRVPLILISPYARTHAVSHVEGDHNAVIETINAIFGLPALASLPDEAQALAAATLRRSTSSAPRDSSRSAWDPAT